MQKDVREIDGIGVCESNLIEIDSLDFSGFAAKQVLAIGQIAAEKAAREKKRAKDEVMRTTKKK